MARKGNVLEIPSVFGSGVATPQVPATREDILRGGGRLSQQVPSQGSIRALFQSRGCCPCPPQSQSGFPPIGQTPGSVDGLGQPPSPQKPFQVVPRDPCEMVEEQLARMGLTPQMLRDCIKPGSSPQRRRQSKPRKRKKPMARASSRRKAPSRRKKKPARRAASKPVSANNGSRFKLFRGKGGRTVCRDSRTNKFVARSKCK